MRNNGETISRKLRKVLLRSSLFLNKGRGIPGAWLWPRAALFSPSPICAQSSAAAGRCFSWPALPLDAEVVSAMSLYTHRRPAKRRLSPAYFAAPSLPRSTTSPPSPRQCLGARQRWSLAQPCEGVPAVSATEHLRMQDAAAITRRAASRRSASWSSTRSRPKTSVSLTCASSAATSSTRSAGSSFVDFSN